jgi:MFS transporter, AAHS family, 3-hydroxyphenylpropionic acid transporter
MWHLWRFGYVGKRDKGTSGLLLWAPRSIVGAWIMRADGRLQLMNAIARGWSGAATATLVFCGLAALCEGIDLQAAGVAASGIAAEFKSTPDQMGTFFSGSTFGLFIGALIGGRLADRVGRKKTLVGSVALFGLFSLMTQFSWDMTSLSWARVLTGFGLGGALPNLIALVSESASGTRRPGTVAMVYSAMPFGGGIASLLSLMLPASSWRVIFIAGGVIPLLLSPLMAFGLQESAAFRGLRAATSDAASPGAHLPAPGSPWAILSDGRAARTLLLWVSFFLGLLILYLLLNWLPTLMVSDGLTRVQAAGAQIGFNVGGAVAALFIGHQLSREGRTWTVVTTFVAMPLLLLALAKAPPSLTIIVLIVCSLGCSVIAAQAFLYAMAPIPYPTAIRGIGVGAAVAAGRIGSIVGPKLGGMLKARGHDSSHLLLDLLPIVIVGSVCALLLAWYLPAQRAHNVGGLEL